jgi:hypothetical protein
LRKRKINSSKEHSPKMMERISNCPNNREIKELISDFRDVKTSMLVLLYNWEEAHCSYSWQDHSSRAMNKGNILFSHSESEHRHASA